VVLVLALYKHQAILLLVQSNCVTYLHIGLFEVSLAFVGLFGFAALTAVRHHRLAIGTQANGHIISFDAASGYWGHHHWVVSKHFECVSVLRTF